MNISIVHPKIVLPSRRSDLLSRPRLLDLVYNLLDYKLLLVIAPAGYGKTSLLVDLAHQNELPFCWYAIDSLDQEPPRFVAHFTAAIAHRFPALSEAAATITQSASRGDLRPDQLARFLAAEVFEKIQEHFVMVLDDYHLVDENPWINQFVNRFLQETGENMHLAMLSRALLPLPDLPLMIARSQVGGLGFRELIFNPDEIRDLLTQNDQRPVSEGEAEKLFRETEGWITGLLMTSHAADPSLPDRIRLAHVSGIGLYDYLAQQVLERQPSSIQDFLLHTCLFDEFDVQLCEQVLGQPPGQESWAALLKQVLKQNLFVIPVGEGNRWLRYHPLFRSFLQNYLAKERPDEEQAILLSFAAACQQRGEWEKAHAIYLRLGDLDSVAQLVEAVGGSLIENGRVSTLNSWLDTLPGRLLVERPAILVLRGVSATEMGEISKGLEYLDQAVARLKNNGNGVWLVLALVWLAFTHYKRGVYTASLAAVEQALSICRWDTSLASLKAEALRIKGLNQRALGRLTDAIHSMEEALASFQSLHEVRSAARLSSSLGAALAESGFYAQALLHYEAALDYYRRTSNLFALPEVLNDLGVLHSLRGEYVPANDLLEEALAEARKIENNFDQTLTLASLGDLYFDLDAFEAAESAYSQARRLLNLGENAYLHLYLSLTGAALKRRQGDLPAAQAYLDEAARLVTRSQSSSEHALWLAEHGRLAMALQDLPQAVADFKEAALALTLGGQRVEGGRTYLYLGAAFFESGDRQAASESLQKAFELTQSLESRHILVTAARAMPNFLQACRHMPALKAPTRQLIKQVAQLEKDLPGLRRHLRKEASLRPEVPAVLKVEALGKAKVTFEGKPITLADWQTQVTRDLFFSLLNSPEGMSKDALGEILWPGSSQTQLKLRFKNTLYRLRRALRQEVVIFDDERYFFNRALDYEYDVELFWEKLAQARKAASPEKKTALLRAAVRLYQGPYLPEGSGTWAVSVRERLAAAYTGALLEMASLSLEQGAFRSTLDSCSLVLEQDMHNEEAHRLAMRAHAALGNQAEVTRQFDRCRQALLKELGIRPSTQTLDLYQSLTH